MALYAKCGLTLPSDVVSADKLRSHDSCVAGLKYPGDGYSAGTLNTCAGELGTAACRGSNPTVDTCGANVGTLANGTACNKDTQCKSGYCNLGTPSADGGVMPDCGTCSASVAIGTACQATDHCVIGSACLGAVCVAL